MLSHHVDEFSLVSAFFLFSVGCLNMLIGLFREKVKHKRSIMSWREEAKGVLPTHKDLRPPFVRSPQAFTKMDDDDVYGHRGNGFGRQGEKAAGLKGTSDRR